MLDVGALIRWDLVFYEPWFLATGAGTIGITAVACALVVT